MVPAYPGLKASLEYETLTAKPGKFLVNREVNSAHVSVLKVVFCWGWHMLWLKAVWCQSISCVTSLMSPLNCFCVSGNAVLTFSPRPLCHIPCSH